MHVHGRRWRETYALSCLENRLMPMVPGKREDWSASPDGMVVRRCRSLSAARTGLLPAVLLHPPQTLKCTRTKVPTLSASHGFGHPFYPWL